MSDTTRSTSPSRTSSCSDRCMFDRTSCTLLRSCRRRRPPCRREFISIYRNSFKQFLGLPAALPSNILNRIFTPTLSSANLQNRRQGEKSVADSVMMMTTQIKNMMRVISTTSKALPNQRPNSATVRRKKRRNGRMIEKGMKHPTIRSVSRNSPRTSRFCSHSHRRDAHVMNDARQPEEYSSMKYSRFL